MVEKAKSLAIAFFPFAILFLLVGWPLYFVGSNKRISGFAKKKLSR